jgi:hypothetical protein
MKKKTEEFTGENSGEDTHVSSPDGAERASMAKDVSIPEHDTEGIKSREQAHAQKIAEIQGGK